MDVATFGAVLAGALVFIQTLIAAFFASRNKRGDAAFRWRKRMEPVHLDLLDWVYETQEWAARNGLRHVLPPLPPSLKNAELDEDSSLEFEMLKRQVERRDDGTT